MELIEEYILLAKVCSSTDYSDKKSVRKHNKAVNRMIAIAKEISSLQDLELLNSFKNLLNQSDDETHIWVAIHLLEYFSIDPETESKSLKIIEKQAENDLGYQFWLSNYHEKK